MNWTLVRILAAGIVIVGGLWVGSLASAGSSKRQLNFATAGLGVFYLAVELFPDPAWPVELITYAFGLVVVIAMFRAYKRTKRERRGEAG